MKTEPFSISTLKDWRASIPGASSRSPFLQTLKQAPCQGLRLKFESAVVASENSNVLFEEKGV